MRIAFRTLALFTCAVILAGAAAAATAHATQQGYTQPPATTQDVTPAPQTTPPPEPAAAPEPTPYVPSALSKSPSEMAALMEGGEGPAEDGEDAQTDEEEAAEELERTLNEKQYFFNSLLPGQPAPYTLEVDVVNQVVTAYGMDADGLYTVIARQMICSTGKKATPTLLGKFIMPGERRDRHEWALFPKYNVYAQYTSRIYKGYLFHSVLYNKRNDNTLISSSVRNLGRRASHGCIRLQVIDAKWIYENCPPGTVVHVFDDGAPNPDLTSRLKAAVSSSQKLD